MKFPKIALLGLVSFVMCLGMVPSCCQESIAQDTAVVSAPAIGEPSKESLSKFRTALLKAADQAAKDKEISRLDVFKLRLATMNRGTLERLHQATAEHVLSEGKFASYSAIDWNQLLAFIKELLPIILELIKLFSSNETTLIFHPGVSLSSDHYSLAA
jgi:hypothetical protein